MQAKSPGLYLHFINASNCMNTSFIALVPMQK
jgi:hypothetical protein